MNLVPVAIAALLSASLAAWILSGSPVPMALSLLVLLVAPALGPLFLNRGGKRRRYGPIIAPLMIAGLALVAELHFYLSGEALVLRATLPLPFHFSLALLWWVAADLLVGLPRGQQGQQGQRRHQDRHGLIGIAGGLFLLAAAAATDLSNIGPWVIYPFAALPALAFASRFLLPTLSFGRNVIFVLLPGSLAVTALLLGSGAAAETLRPWFSPNEVDQRTQDESRPAAPGGENAISDGASRHLPREADVRFRGQVMVQVKAHRPELFRSWLRSPLYVRTATLALFENDEVISPIRSGRWRYDRDDGSEDNLIALPSPESSTSIPYSLYLTRESIGHLPLLAGSGILFTDAVYEFADDWYQLAPPPEVTNLRYTATAPLLVPQTDKSLHQLLQRNIPGETGIYLGLPPSPLAARVTTLTSGFDRTDPLGEIRRFLASQTRYSLQFKTPDGSSPVESFLFGSGEGHCEHYAAATVLMLRSLGIASRVAYGYAGGAADTGKQVLVFRDNDFHAWAEIQTRGSGGWAIFDTTPHVPNAAPRPPGSITLPAWNEALYHNVSASGPSENEVDDRFSEQIAALMRLFSRHFFLFTVIGLALLAGFRRLLAVKGQDLVVAGAGSGSGPVAPPFLPDFLRELELAGRSLGVIRKPGHTWREYLARLGSLHSPGPDLTAAVAYYYAVCYSGRDRDLKAEDHFLDRIRQWHHDRASD